MSNRRIDGARVAAFTWLVVACAAVLSTAQSPRVALPGNRVERPLPCGTEVERDRRTQAIAPNGLADGEPLFFDQDPPVIRPDYTGPITLKRFNVVGDYATVQFLRYDRDLPDGVLETWPRVTSRSVSGQIISIFEPTWTSAQFGKALGTYRVGHDQPDLSWGVFKVPGSSSEHPLRLRIGFAGIPASRVVKINDQVQYASSVVNLVVPNFGDARVGGGSHAFEFEAATRLFYEHFADSYEVLAIQPASTTFGGFGAFHQNVANAVRGLNLSLFNRADAYGSGGTLQGVDLYALSNAARYQDTNHEMSHQWGSNFDWTRIAGVTRGGHEPNAHSPLWTGGETLIGAVLYPDRRVHDTPAGLAIERTPAPSRYHPIELYAMGAIGAEQVPPFDVMENQSQFGDSTASPDVATHVEGGVRHVTIDDVVREHGARVGPTFKTWRRGLIYVSRDRLATASEMDFWNFYAQRLADRDGTNAPTYDGYGSFRRATQERMSLTTAIRPRTSETVAETLDTSSPVFGPADLRDLFFTAPVPTRLHVGESIVLRGRVTAQDAVDFDDIAFILYRADGGKLRFDGDVNRTRDFAVALRFRESDRGQYSMGAFLFWPNSGSQFPRATLSTFTVE